MLLAVSSCLLGNKVRYDGSSKNNRFVLQELNNYCDFVAVCPEHLAFGTPRPTIHIAIDLSTTKQSTRAVANDTNNDVTEALLAAIDTEIAGLKALPIAGIILKSKSPSCGVGSCGYYHNGVVVEHSDGLFVKAIKTAFPHLPLEEESRLNDAWFREQFVTHLFAFEAMAALQRSISSHQQLSEFHTDYTLLLQAKSFEKVTELEQLLAKVEQHTLDEVMASYCDIFYQTIALPTSIEQTIKVLTQTLDLMAHDLDAKDRAGFANLMTNYRDRIIPLVTITARLKYFAKKHNNAVLLRQRFLNPYPEPLTLRSTMIDA